MTAHINLQDALKRIERLEGAVMGIDCFISALLKTLPPETARTLEKWAEVELAETKVLMNASPDHSDEQIAGLDEFAHTFCKVRTNR